VRNYRTITIVNLYEATLRQVNDSPAEWTAFLRSACKNYKCRFDEQVLIYAQRPDATAVLEIEKWNKNFGRWVNKGATGIATFDDGRNAGYRLKHYFDIADTHESRLARPVSIWRMEARYESDVIEHLENSFGELEDKSTLAASLISAAANAVDDNLPDYLDDLKECLIGSPPKDPDSRDVEAEYRTALQNSAAYMLLTRCGINANDYLSLDDFRFISDFNTRQTVSALGIAASDISEMCLREIAASVINLDRQEKNKNRTFENSSASTDNESNSRKESQRERSNDGSINIPDGERLPDSESDRAAGAGRSPWQVRINAKEVPEAKSPSSVPEPTDRRNAEPAPSGNRADREQANGTYDGADGAGE
jgi:hypothetical protein